MIVKLKNIYVCSYIKCNQIENYYLKINDGGSEKDTQLNVLTGNTLPSTISSTENQMFILYTNNGDGAPAGKGFSASFTFGIKKQILTFLNYSFNNKT